MREAGGAGLGGGSAAGPLFEFAEAPFCRPPGATYPVFLSFRASVAFGLTPRLPALSPGRLGHDNMPVPVSAAAPVTTPEAGECARRLGAWVFPNLKPLTVKPVNAWVWVRCAYRGCRRKTRHCPIRMSPITYHDDVRVLQSPLQRAEAFTGRLFRAGRAIRLGSGRFSG